MVFQNYALYPHMSVFENIAFPLRSRSVPKAEIRERVERTAEMLGLTSSCRGARATSRAGSGSASRWAARSCGEPQVFLMDEPLSNLDAKLRVQMRAEISRLQRELGVTTIYVTHDQVEAMTMGTRIAVMRKGVLQQVGAPQELYDRPANLFVADVHRLARDEPLPRAGSSDRRRPRRSSSASSGCALPAPPPALAGVPRARGRARHPARASGLRRGPATAASTLRGHVRLVETLGFERLVHADVPGSPVLTDEVVEVARDIDASAVQALEREAALHVVPVVARLDGAAGVRSGDTLDVAVDPAHLHFFDLETGAAVR